MKSTKINKKDIEQNKLIFNEIFKLFLKHGARDLTVDNFKKLSDNKERTPYFWVFYENRGITPVYYKYDTPNTLYTAEVPIVGHEMEFPKITKFATIEEFYMFPKYFYFYMTGIVTKSHMMYDFIRYRHDPNKENYRHYVV